MGITRLLSGLFATQLLDVDQHAPTKVLVTVMDPQFQVTSVRLAKQLQGHNVATEVYVGSAALGRQLAYAQRQRIPIALIIGQREVERMEVSVRDLRAGEQFTVPATRLRDVVIDLLNGQRARSSAR